MTVTCAPFSEGVALEHWGTRTIVYLSPKADTMDWRMKFLAAARADLHKSHRMACKIISPELYEKRRSSMIEVPWEYAEAVFDIPVPGRPDAKEPYPVPLPPLETESARSQGRWKAMGARVLWPVKRYQVATGVMDDLERGLFIARLHMNLADAGHTDLTIKAASADYRESIIVTDSGVLDTLDWTEAAKDRGVSIPRARRLDARYHQTTGEPTITTRRKQVP